MKFLLKNIALAERRSNKIDFVYQFAYDYTEIYDFSRTAEMAQCCLDKYIIYRGAKYISGFVFFIESAAEIKA